MTEEVSGVWLVTACLPGIANPRSVWRTRLGVSVCRTQISQFRMLIIKFKVQISKFKVKTMFKTIDFRALTAITLFMLALLFSLPNLVIAIVLMILISALLEIIKMLAEWQPKKWAEWHPKKLVRRIS